LALASDEAADGVGAVHGEDGEDERWQPEVRGRAPGRQTRQEQLAGNLGDGSWPWQSETVKDARAKISPDGEETKASTGEARRKARMMEHASVGVEDGRRSACSEILRELVGKKKETKRRGDAGGG
jgi:hypothetical protein